MRDWDAELLRTAPTDQKILLAAAAPAEAEALAARFGVPGPFPEARAVPLSPRLDLVRTGVGKAAAASAVAPLLATGRYAGVVNLGIAGSLPGTSPAGLLSTVIASSHALADEGSALPPTPDDPEPFQRFDRFSPELAPGQTVPGWTPWVDALAAALPGARLAPIATVSVCSGRDALARAIAARTGAAAEAMEGAAVALAARRAGAAYAEVRIISNTTGDRPRQRWQIREALAALAALLPPTPPHPPHSLSPSPSAPAR